MCKVRFNGVTGVLGSMLTDDEAGRVKLTRCAMAVGRVSQDALVCG